MSHRVLILLALAAGLSAEAAAQRRPIGFPTSSTSGTNGNWGPLGEDCQGKFVEARTQILFPAEALPSRAAAITALDHLPVWLTSSSVPCGNTGTVVRYSLLEVTVAHRKRGLGPLSLTFASNLPAPVPPPVFPAQSITIQWALGSWNSIRFATPFQYNGVDDLVVEIRKVVEPTGQNVGSLRNLNPALPIRQITRVGGANSGAATATTASSYVNVLGWRLRFDSMPEPSLEVRSPLGPRKLHFEYGQPFHYRVFAPTGDFFALWLSFAINGAAVSVPPLTGGLWTTGPMVTLSTGVITKIGGAPYHRFDMSIPNDPSLAGLRCHSQSATVSSATGRGHLSNAVQFEIQ